MKSTKKAVLFRVGSMPYYALVLEGSFEASQTLRRGQWCQSEELDDLEQLGLYFIYCIRMYI